MTTQIKEKMRNWKWLSSGGGLFLLVLVTGCQTLPSGLLSSNLSNSTDVLPPAASRSPASPIAEAGSPLPQERSLDKPKEVRSGKKFNHLFTYESPVDEQQQPNGSVGGTIQVDQSWPPQQPASTIFRSQSPDQQDGVRQVAYQTPETQSQPFGNPPSTIQYPSIQTGNINEPNPLVLPNAPSGVGTFPADYTAAQGVADLDVVLTETQTGRINFGGAYNSDNGIVGQFVIDERNFDITAFPRSFQEIVDGTAFRGAGQTFRLELVPGNEVQRYLVSFGDPYLFNTAISFNFSAYLFDRRYFDWDEQRLGGRLALGYRLTPDLSVSAGVRMENVDISDPRLGTSPQLNAVLGDTDLYVGHVGIVRDTRDHPFLATEGSYLSMTYSQGFGEFDFARGDIDYRRYRLLYQRPDGSGRHTLSFGTRLGFTGSQTPVFENYFAGGFSSMRGFDFRGASPVENGVRVGGEFQWLNSLEYMFPLTADDMIKGVLFCDFGTVEDSITIDSDNFRVAPGFGFRIHMPAAGIGAPLAFDFAFPVSSSEFDEEQVFSFYLGVNR